MSDLPIEFEDPTQAICRVPPGAWAVGVSGGADSVALLNLLHRLAIQRSDLRLVVAHLNHQTRGPESDADEEFVAQLAGDLGLTCSAVRRDVIERELPPDELPTNPSARFRRLRQEWFARVVKQNDLRGVFLAHHADDQAETVLQRLLRRSGWTGLCAMAPRVSVRGLTIQRPLLSVRRCALRDYLTARRIGWREDASNHSPKYQRNVVRRHLAGRDELTAALCTLSRESAVLRDWVREWVPSLDASFAPNELSALPAVLARQAAATWLSEHGVPRADLLPATIDRLLTMCADAASPGRVTFPGGVIVRRRSRRVFVERGPGSES